MPEGRRAQSACHHPCTRPVVPPVHHSVTDFLGDQSDKDVRAGGLAEVWYGRFRNPILDVAAEAVARLEEAEPAYDTMEDLLRALEATR